MQRSFAALCVCLIQQVHAEHVDRALLQDGIDGEVIALEDHRWSGCICT